MNTIEQASVEELLKPRYKVIADYPFMPYETGDLVHQSGETSVYKSFHLTTTVYEDDFGRINKSANWSDIEAINRYPHLFKRLEWWEERKESDMPEYVKIQSTVTGVIQDCQKVKGWSGCCSVVEFYGNQEGATSFWLPATQSEYLNQKQ